MIKNFKTKITVLLIGIFLLPLTALSATLYIEPEEGNYHLGDVFLAEIRINTEGKPINTVKADIAFSSDILEVKGFAKGGSVLSLFAEEPVFSNRTGEISFAGGIPGGFLGDGLLGKIAFEAKKEGEGIVEIDENSRILLNDGMGTLAEISTKKALFNILPETSEILKDEWQEMLGRDETPPEPFEIIITRDPNVFEGKYFIVFSTTDIGTGVDYYEVKEGDREWKKGESPYLLEDQNLEGIIKVRAVDKAGNERIAEYDPSDKKLLANPLFWIILILIIAWIIGLAVIKLKKEKYAREKDKNQ